jgi:hypothetical protein
MLVHILLVMYLMVLKIAIKARYLIEYFFIRLYASFCLIDDTS